MYIYIKPYSIIQPGLLVTVEVSAATWLVCAMGLGSAIRLTVRVVRCVACCFRILDRPRSATFATRPWRATELLDTSTLWAFCRHEGVQGHGRDTYRAQKCNDNTITMSMPHKRVVGVSNARSCWMMLSTRQGAMGATCVHSLEQGRMRLPRRDVLHCLSAGSIQCVECLGQQKPICYRVP